MTKLESYWITNKEWYGIDDDGNPFLTDKATPEAIESFKKFKRQLIEKKDAIWISKTEKNRLFACSTIENLDKIESGKMIYSAE